MSIRDLALARGLDDTRATLVRWNAAPAPVAGRWALWSLVIASALLYVVWAISHRTVPDTRPLLLPGLNAPAGLEDVARVLARNGLVLALHALACVAGFIAGSALPEQAEQHRGAWRRVHELAGPAAIAFVGAATLFSLVTQALVLAHGASTIAWQQGISPGLLLLSVLPHALPELIAVFLPLAAWILLSRRGRWDEMLAATLVTTVMAFPVIVAAAFVEIYLWPHLLLGLLPG